MKMHKPLKLLIISIIALISIGQKVIAFEPLSAKELASHCVAYAETPESLDAQFCIRYIQGFSDGAIATNTQVMLNAEAEKKTKETFTERAMRTRKSRGTKQGRALQYAEFCLGKTIKLKEIVSKVAKNLEQRKKIEDSILARAVVYGILKQEYPCQNITTKNNE